MKTWLSLLFVLFASVLRADETGRLEVLFLGDHDHHTPDKRFFQALPALGPRGINLTYTDQLSDLNPATLAQYDVLAIYANWLKILPPQEKALLDFVQGGKGFVPIHCASACFGNSPEYIRLVGGRFKSHGTGTFKVAVDQPGHAIMQGLAGFETWDETYVHDQLNPDKMVLQNRDGEPWTWVRNEGKGRVFYTAYGHDQRTWSNPGFQELLYRGIVWAAGDAAAARLKAWTPKPFAYDPTKQVPNYENRKPAPQYQLPLSPEESRKHIQKPVDTELKLAASEESAVKLVNVVEFQWDERGRLWVVESLDYPNDIKPGGPGNDRIRILEDTDGDGVFDKATVFADELSVPTSLCFAGGGVVVQQAPQTLFFRDTNGDGKADEKKILFSGWGVSDTHAGPSSLHLGLDGWVYGCVGYAGFSGTAGGEAQRFGSGFYRFKADGSKLEFLGRTSNNTWGFSFNENGDIFGSTANNQPSVYLPIPRRYYDLIDGAEQPVNPGIMVNLKAPKMMERIRQVDVFDGFTAEACHNIYTARAFPREFWNRVAFLCEPTVHIVYKGVLQNDGAQFRTENGWNLLASDDEHFAPVFADVGPDGAIWVSDFYSFIIQHNPTPSAERGGFNARTGRGSAFISELRDTQRARIWRLSAKNGTPSKQWKLSKDDPKGLLEALQSDNRFWRMTAQRLLVERGQPDVVDALKKIVAENKPDEIGVAGGALHALWTLQQLGAADVVTVTAALKHPAAGVRRAAAQVMPRMVGNAQAILNADLLHDADPLVRLSTLLALADQPAYDPVGAALFALNEDPVVKADKWLPTALTIAATRHANGYLTAALQAAKPDAGAAPKPEAMQPVNVLQNGNIEAFSPGLPPQPLNWEPANFGGKAQHAVVKKGRNGGTCLEITSTDGADSAWAQDVKVEAGCDYLLSCWIKTDALQGATGALLEIHNLNGGQPKSAPVTGTSDWKLVSFKISTGAETKFQLNCLFGGWGRSRGTAWFDDISVVKIGRSNGKGGGGGGDPFAVARSFARYATPTQLTSLNALLASKPGPLSRGISEALKAPPTAPKTAENLEALAKTHQLVYIKAVEGLKYDVLQFTVKAGKPIAVVFADADSLQHNLVFVKPGALEACCQVADGMAAQPDAITKHYIPSFADIVKATKLLNPGDVEVLKFDALPPGDYSYLCTFPGHCHVMRGTMKVE
jgi:putative membrane-bound dehydrogenase-like protein